MIKSNEGSIEIYGDIDDVKADLGMIIIKLLETELFSFKDIDKVVSIAKKMYRKYRKEE